jgi:CheY-like chemotaxis protein
MPEIDGLETCIRIREMEHLAQVPILILTSVSYFGNRRELTSAGADGVLTKPIKQSQLRHEILVLLGLYESNGGKAEAKEESEKVRAPLPAPGRKEARVLVVEDNSINQRIAVALLARAGCRSEVANNGKEALSALARIPFDLVLMDCQMPTMDGYEATRRLRERERMAGGHIPVIAMTANAMVGDRERCLEAGMDDYLPKPVVSAELYTKLATWLCVPEQESGAPA